MRGIFGRNEYIRMAFVIIKISEIKIFVQFEIVLARDVGGACVLLLSLWQSIRYQSEKRFSIQLNVDFRNENEMSAVTCWYC